jgi:hypothetical protein
MKKIELYSNNNDASYSQNLTNTPVLETFVSRFMEIDVKSQDERDDLKASDSMRKLKEKGAKK